MNIFTRTFKTAALFSCLAALPFPIMAEDVDIFVGSSGGTAVAPNVVMLLDDTANWSRNATNFCAANPSSTSCPTFPTGMSGLSYNQSGTVGGNELNAIIGALTILYKDNKANINIGLATYAEQGNLQNGYMRYGARNLGDATTGAQAYSSLMTILSNLNPTAAVTKVNVGNKDEAESLFQLYQYFNSGKPGTLAVNTSGLADYPGGTGDNANPDQDAAGNNYTAYSSSSCGTTGGACTYRGPSTACAKNYIIYVANHGNNNGKNGFQSYSTASPGSTTVTASDSITPMSVVTASGSSVSAESARWIVEWADFLYKNNITLYVIDIGVSSLTNPDTYSVTLQQAAKLGGGKYYALTDAATESDMNTLKVDLLEIFGEIQAVNSTFASVSLPISATNRAQNQNQVFIPMFRPDVDAKPLWRGNLKQYQLILLNGSIVLSDVGGTTSAVNENTGFATPCAQSFWTTDSSTYWQNVTQNPSAKGQCSTATQWSDSPDGSQVEKGGVAEVIRKGNNPAGATTWNVNRIMYTQPLAGGTLAAFSTSSPGLDTATGLSSSTTPTLTTVVDFIRGKDVNGEYNNPPPPGIASTPASLTRPSLHGDTIHSQPLPVTYSGSTGVYVYYGSNDGTLRAINGATGQEQWSFIAPEFYSKLKRLQASSPLINFPNLSASVTPTPIAKDYFFDGSIGLYQNADNTNIWIYPSMRRGGRMLYAFDVTSPTTPVFKWKVGCPNLTNDTGCMATSSSSWTGTSISSMGQTWSTPNIAARVLGHSGPVMVVGGGYDTCEDTNSFSPSCSSPKGAKVYLIDADTGALLKSFDTERSVAADVALLAVATPGVIDHAYAVDTGGNIYRIDFSSAGPSSWAMNKIAYTTGGGRKFLYPPTLFHNPGNYVYVALGSGDREHPLQSQYPYTTPVTNRFYVFTDNLASTTAIDLDNSSLSNVVTNAAGATCEAAKISDRSGAQTKSFYLDLTGTGEQTVTSALIVGGMVTFSSNRPVPAASGSCSTTLGEARGYWLNLFTGSGAIGTTKSCGGSTFSTFVGGGLPPSPVFANVLIGGQSYPVVIGAIQRAGGASSPIAPQKVTLPLTQIRNPIYWKSSNVDR